MSESRRTICVATGSRAEYGLLYWLMKQIDEDPKLHLQIIATGSHLSEAFGLTIEHIQADGFTIDCRVEALAEDDAPASVAAAIGRGVAGFAEALTRLQPDVFVVLGDRYEIFAAAQAAAVLGIPIAHIHGGELSEGVLDDSIRHCITKLSQLHFVAAEPYRQRVIQLGEQPDRVFNFGAPGLDHLANTPLLSQGELEKALGIKLSQPLLLVTYHPVTLGDQDAAGAFEQLLAALDQFPQARVILTKANADAGGRRINDLIDGYATGNPARVSAHTSLGIQRYLSLVKLADVVVGNSSSGLIEAPALQTPTVNVGDRQRGRLRAGSVIDCAETTEEIEAAIRRALSTGFQDRILGVRSPYGAGGVSVKIKDVLKETDLRGIIVKRFNDLPSEVAVQGGVG